MVLFVDKFGFLLLIMVVFNGVWWIKVDYFVFLVMIDEMVVVVVLCFVVGVGVIYVYVCGDQGEYVLDVDCY